MTTPAGKRPILLTEDKGAAWLAASFSTVTALVAVVGASPGGVVDRVLRHEGWALFLVFLLAILAISSAVATYVWQAQRENLLVASMGLFAIGMVLLAFLVTVSRIDTERPIVRGALKTEGGLSLEASSKATGLRSSQQMFLYVYGLRIKKLDQDGNPIFERELFYTSQTGPDRTGLAEIAFQTPVPAARYSLLGIAASLDKPPRSCDFSRLIPDAPEGQGCTLIRIPVTSKRPSLFATLTGSGDSRILSVDVHAENVAATESLFVRIVGIAPRPGGTRTLYRSILGADTKGIVDGQIEFPIHAQLRAICVDATPVGILIRPSSVGSSPDAASPNACPVRNSRFSTTTRLPLR